MLSAIVDEMLPGVDRAVVIAHREELINQNAETFQQICPDRPISYYDGKRKSWDGQVTFSTIQTLSRENHLNTMKPISFLVYDEAHHSRAKTYLRLTKKCQKMNPDLKILGVTATPERGDRKGLMPTFDNVADVIQLQDMVKRGHLVKPIGKVVDIGVTNQLAGVKTKNDFTDQKMVDEILNTQKANNAVIREWEKYAKDRQTVFFCASIKHAEALAQNFQDNGYDAHAVHSKTSSKDRKKYLNQFNNGDIQILTNPMLLTEGWDSPVCSCVGILRKCSYKSTLIQMAGRGLRKNPVGIKTDCLVLDFGTSLLTHGDLETNILLKDKEKNKDAPAPEKKCPSCNTVVPAACRFCPICGHEFIIDTDVVEQFEMTDFDLIDASPFKWMSLWEGGRVRIATGFDSWVCVCSPDEKIWYAIGGTGYTAKRLCATDLVGAMASADDFMRVKETNASAKKVSRWMSQPATQKQNQILQKYGYGIDALGQSGMSKIEAASHITFRFNQKRIENIMGF